MQIDEILWLPDEAKAILFDMDGVLLDSLGLDFTLCNQLLRKHANRSAHLSKEFIRSIFAYHPPEFWRRIFVFLQNEQGLVVAEDIRRTMLDEYNSIRNASVFAVNPGIETILKACREQDIKTAVVSNNPTKDVEKILIQSGIAAYFDVIVGNDLAELKKKPEPDTYLHAAARMDVPPKSCVVVEDSLIGAEAGCRAGCFTVGVATGGTSFEELEQSPWTHRVYSSFQPSRLVLRSGSATDKRLHAPNDFVSHAIEHIAWRLGCGIDLFWSSSDWPQLGRTLGSRIAKFRNRAAAAATLGMIDDGSAEVSIALANQPKVDIEAVGQIDLSWFLSLRCEQLSSGGPLIELLRGLAEGLKVRIHVRICGVEDPHHAWEGVFRSVGIVLNSMFVPPAWVPSSNASAVQATPPLYGIVVEELSARSAAVVRTTAESRVRVSVSCGEQWPGAYSFRVAPSISVSGFAGLLEIIARAAGFTLSVDFAAERLNSSHVVMEDTGLVLGRVLKELFVLHMNSSGVQGSGSSIQSEEDFKTQPIGVGISVEGRKFVKFVPFCEPYSEFRKRFLLGHSVFGGLFSEDLDDFLDGLAGGLGCSIMIHVRSMIAADEGWQMLFSHLGKALKDAFCENPSRKGIPPGVKATLC